MNLISLSVKAFLKTIILVTLPILAPAQSESVIPARIPWHTGLSIEKMQFSADGLYLVTLGDDEKIIVSDLKKRLPVYQIEKKGKIDFVVHPFSPHLYTFSYQSDSMLILKRNIETGNIERETKIPVALYDQTQGEPWRQNHPGIRRIDYSKNQFIVPFSNFRETRVCVFDESGNLLKSFTGPGSDRINAIEISSNLLLVATSEELFKAAGDAMISVLKPGGKDNHFTNMKIRGDTLVMLSNKKVQWVRLKDFRVSQESSIESFFSQTPEGMTRAGIARFNHPFEVDENGDAWVVDTRLYSLTSQKTAPFTFYQLAKVNDKVEYPFTTKVNSITMEAQPLEVPFAYNPLANLFALIETGNPLSVMLYDKTRGELFRVGQNNIGVEKLYFTKTPGKVLLQCGTSYSDTYPASFILDLRNGRIDPTGIIDKRYSTKYRDSYKVYESTSEKLWLHHAYSEGYEEANFLQREENHFLNFYCDVSYKDTLHLPLPQGGRFSLNKENGHMEWHMANKKNNRTIQLKTELNKEIEFFEYAFEKYQYDSASSLLTLCYSSQRQTNGLQYVINVNTSDVVKQWTFPSGVTVFKNGTMYVNEDGIYRMKNDSMVARLPEKYRPFITRGVDFTISRDEQYILYMDYADNIIAFNIESGEAKVLGTQSDVNQMAADPHSLSLYTVSGDGIIRIWSITDAREIASLSIQGKKEFHHIQEVQPSYVILLPDGFYMGENRYYDMLRLQDGGNQFPVYKMDARFNRPDKVLKALNYSQASFIGPIEKIAEKRSAKIEKKIKGDIAITNKNQLPYFSDQEIISINTALTEGLEKSLGIMVYVNGTALWQSPGKPAANHFTTTVDLVDEVNHIRVCLTDNEGNESPGDYLYINSTPAENKNLYMIGIGVSQYADTLWNLKYAEKDMRDLTNYIKTLQSYNEVFTLEVAGADVSKEITRNIATFLKDAKSSDEVIVYYAGHGLLDKDQDFFLSTYKMDFKDPGKNGLNIEDITAAVSESYARKKIILIDACNSGLIDDMQNMTDHLIPSEINAEVVTEKRGAVAETGATQNMASIHFTFTNFNPGNGVNILAAAAGNESALEGGGLKNGLFTHSVITALKTGEADFDKNEVITINELQLYVTDKVSTLSRGAQRPTFRQANIFMDIPVVKVSDSYFSNFIEAVKTDHLGIVQLMLENEDVNVNKKDDRGLAALHYASRQGYFKMVKYLISKGANIDEVTVPGKLSPVYLAAYNGHARVLYWLIESGADTTNLRNDRMIKELKEKNQTAILTMLRDYASVRRTEDNHLLFIQQLGKGNISLADSLFRSQSLNVDYWHMKAGASPLLAAIATKKHESLKWLLERKANVNLPTPDEGFTALMLAVYLRNDTAVKMLLEHGADKEIKDYGGKRAIDHAREVGNEFAIESLTE